MDTIARVRRAFHVQVKKITRELNISRNTVRKILRSDATEFAYKREHQPLPRMGARKRDVEQFLIANEGKASHDTALRRALPPHLRRIRASNGPRPLHDVGRELIDRILQVRNISATMSARRETSPVQSEHF